MLRLFPQCHIALILLKKRNGDRLEFRSDRQQLVASTGASPPPLSFSPPRPPTRRRTSAGSPTTKGRWHGSSLRDRLHFRPRAGRTRYHRAVGSVSRPPHQRRQGHHHEP